MPVRTKAAPPAGAGASRSPTVQVAPRGVLFGHALFLLVCGLAGYACGGFDAHQGVHGVRFAVPTLLCGLVAGRVASSRVLGVLAIDVALLMLVATALNYLRLTHTWLGLEGNLAYRPVLASVMAAGSLASAVLLWRVRPSPDRRGGDWWAPSPLLALPILSFWRSRRRHGLGAGRRLCFGAGIVLTGAGLAASAVEAPRIGAAALRLEPAGEPMIAGVIADAERLQRILTDPEALARLRESAEGGGAAEVEAAVPGAAAGATGNPMMQAALEAMRSLSLDRNASPAPPLAAGLPGLRSGRSRMVYAGGREEARLSSRIENRLEPERLAMATSRTNRDPTYREPAVDRGQVAWRAAAPASRAPPPPDAAPETADLSRLWHVAPAGTVPLMVPPVETGLLPVPAPSRAADTREADALARLVADSARSATETAIDRRIEQVRRLASVGGVVMLVAGLGLISMALSRRAPTASAASAAAPAALAPRR